MHRRYWREDRLAGPKKMYSCAVVVDSKLGFANNKNITNAAHWHDGAPKK